MSTLSNLGQRKRITFTTLTDRIKRWKGNTSTVKPRPRDASSTSISISSQITVSDDSSSSASPMTPSSDGSPVINNGRISPLNRFMSFATFRSYEKGATRGKTRSTEDVCPISISSPCIAPGTEFAFTLVSLEEARADMEIVFRKEAFEDTTDSKSITSSEFHHSDDSDSDIITSTPLQYFVSSISRRRHHLSVIDEVSIASESNDSAKEPLLSQWPLSASPQQHTSQPEDIDTSSMHSSAIHGESKPLQVQGTPNVKFYGRMPDGDFDITNNTTLSSNLGNTSGELSVSQSGGDGYAAAQIVLAVRSAVRNALAAEALDA